MKPDSVHDLAAGRGTEPLSGAAPQGRGAELEAAGAGHRSEPRVVDGGRGGFSRDSFAGLAQAEDRHFWFRARNALIAAALDRLAPAMPAECRALEIGCGTGNVLHVLRRVLPRGTVVGMDLHAEGLVYAAKRSGGPLVQGDACRLPFRGPFDLVCLFDVLEHLPEDGRVLQEARSLLAPGGYLLLTVPANPGLWSAFDETSCHLRRYAPAGLRARLVGAGCTVEYLTPCFAALAPLVRLWRKAAYGGRSASGEEQEEWVRRTNSELRVVPGVNGLLAFALRQEARLVARGIRIPAGTSLLAIARAGTG